MSLPDKHDTRTFNHYAHLAADGTVLAVTECVATRVPMPTTSAVRIVDVTTLHPYDFTGVVLSADSIETLPEAELVTLLAAANLVARG